MLFSTTPIIQYTQLDDFLADLNTGHVIGVWHSFLTRSDFFNRRHTIIRALVINTDVFNITHIAAIAFAHDTRVIAANGRPADDEAHRQAHALQHRHLIDHLTEQLATIGILADRIRAGVLDIPFTTIIYAQPPSQIAL